MSRWLSATLVLGGLLVFTGCFFDYASKNKAKQSKAAASGLVGSWVSVDGTRFLEISDGGSIVASEKDSADEDIGFYQVVDDKILISKSKENTAKRTEVASLDIVSKNEIVFGENQEYWNVVRVTGRWFREGVDIKEEIAKAEIKKLSPLEQKLVEYKNNKAKYEKFVLTLEGDRKSQVIKLSKLDQEKDAESWKLLANALSVTIGRLEAVKNRTRTYAKAIERIELAIADQKRSQDLKDLGLTDDELKELSYAIHETEDQLPIREGAASDFTLKTMVDEELQRFNKENESEKKD